MFKNCKLPRTRIAFNDPTDAGISLAKSYIGDKNNNRYIIHLSYYSLYNTQKEDKDNSFEKPEAKRIKHHKFNEEYKENVASHKKLKYIGFEEEENSD